MFYSSIVKPLLFTKNAESAHDFAIQCAAFANRSELVQHFIKIMFNSSNFGLNKEFWGLNFSNPIGLAAGFDKNGITPLAMQAIGFGFIEIGSITANPSEGNPKPRAFRLPKDKSLINRMGINNEGALQIVDRLKKYNLDVPLGINIAKTNDINIHGDSAIDDYRISYNLASSVADYITINISCPNTGEGKTFEEPAALEALLSGLDIAKNNIPSLVKFSVDTKKKELEQLVQICEHYGVAGYVATNTSSTRENLCTNEKTLEAIGNGGLSGRAIFKKSTQVVSWLYEFLQGSKPIIGVGGIDHLEAAIQKLDAGANLIQLYTGLVYKGPGLVKEIKKGLRNSGSFWDSEFVFTRN